MKPKPPPVRAQSARRRAFLICSLLICASPAALLVSGCGKVGAPIPPPRISERTSKLSGLQRGDRVLLAWPAPPLVREESSRSYIARAEIYRLAERRDEEPFLDIDDYEESARMIGFLDRPVIEAQIKSLGHLEFTDAVDLSQASDLANTRLRYAVRYVNRRNQPAAFSNTVAIEPVPGVSRPPAGLNVVSQAQDAITIVWGAPEANVDGTQPASVVGYNVYRRNEKRESLGEPLNSEPITEAVFTDTKFQYQTPYVYVVRALSQGSAGLIESADSDPLSLTPVDTFPPETPEPLSAASANAVISLFWPSSRERDVVGYNLYRATSDEARPEDWTRLNAQPLTAVTYRDDRVVIGQKYFYRVTAVDRFNNESKPSRVVAETANP